MTRRAHDPGLGTTSTLAPAVHHQAHLAADAAWAYGVSWFADWDPSRDDPAWVRFRGLFDDVARDRHVLVLTTPRPWQMHGRDVVLPLLRQVAADVTVVEADFTEDEKRLATLESLWHRADEIGLGRDDLVVGVGGGVVCDLATMVAAGYRRGIDYVCVPTTLVGQVDAGIGLKGAVNLGTSKNRIGTFRPPVATLFDPVWLGTLDADEVRQGLAEVVKLAVMRDAELFELVERHGSTLIRTGMQAPVDVRDELLDRAIRGMLAELELDPFEVAGGPRRMDFGHTYSPGLEQVSGYTLGHGSAVAVDMAWSCQVAVVLGLLPARDGRRVIDLLQRLGLPTRTRWCHPELMASTLRDAVAQRGGRLRLPLPTEVGAATFVDDLADVPASVIERAWEQLRDSPAPIGEQP